MTESDAWALLAQLWNDARPFALSKPTPHVTPTSERKPCFGLCRSVARLADARRVDRKTLARMRARLDDFLKAAGWRGGYLFPLTADGALKRAAVCWRLAGEAG